MANYASLRGPVGMNRVYALVQGPLEAARQRQWLDALHAGHTLATNGPLLGLTVEGQPPGSEITLNGSGKKLRYTGFLRSLVPVDHLELVVNGQVTRSIGLDRTKSQADFEGSIEVPDNGWLLLRAWNDAASPLIFDLYPYATTNAFFFKRESAPTHCGPDADYFSSWLDRLESAAASHEAYNTPAEREKTLEEIRSARKIFIERR
jgi:hypothetical protein